MSSSLLDTNFELLSWSFRILFSKCHSSILLLLDFEFTLEHSWQYNTTKWQNLKESFKSSCYPVDVILASLHIIIFYNGSSCSWLAFCSISTFLNFQTILWVCLPLCSSATIQKIFSALSTTEDFTFISPASFTKAHLRNLKQ